MTCSGGACKGNALHKEKNKQKGEMVVDWSWKS